MIIICKFVSTSHTTIFIVLSVRFYEIDFMKLTL
nr:MAG TPA: hypothetical protein [Caudoviricetes sp.]